MIKVHNMANFGFWLGCFKPRSEKWQKDTLKRLKKEVSLFESLEENQDKITALEFLFILTKTGG